MGQAEIVKMDADAKSKHKPLPAITVRALLFSDRRFG